MDCAWAIQGGERAILVFVLSLVINLKVIRVLFAVDWCTFRHLFSYVTVPMPLSHFFSSEAAEWSPNFPTALGASLSQQDPCAYTEMPHLGLVVKCVEMAQVKPWITEPSLWNTVRILSSNSFPQIFKEHPSRTSHNRIIPGILLWHSHSLTTQPHSHM